MATEAAKVRVTITDASTFVERVSTSVVGAVITATKGPIDELTEITSRAQLEEIFGDVTSDHLGMVAADSHFDLGNGRLFLVRVGVSDVGVTGHLAKSTATVVDQTTPTPVEILKFTMNEYGTYGDAYKVDVSGVSAGAATIKIYLGDTLLETKAVSLNDQSSNFVETVFADDDYCTCEVLVPDASSASLKVDDVPFSGGSDGLVGQGDEDELRDVYIGEYDGATDTYTGAQLLLQRTDTINVLATYGYTDKEYVNALGTIAQNRQDCIVVVDAPAGLVPAKVIEWADGTGDYDLEAPVAGWWFYVIWDWQRRTVNGVVIDAPPSGYFTSKVAYNDDLFGFHLPVAGLSRGIINSGGCVKSPTPGQADTLVAAQINPIIDMGRQGIVIWGNETRNTVDSDLDALHVVRTLLYCIDSIKRSSRAVMFELNNETTWNRWKNAVGAFLLSMKSRGALASYSVHMGANTMTQNDVQNRVMKGRVELQFFMDGEVIEVNFEIQASGL